MKPLLALLMALLTACSDGQSTSGPKPDADAQRLAPTAQPRIALTGRVTDAADILDAAQEARLSKSLEQLERTRGHQMVVVTVPTLRGQEVAAYTRDLGNAWGIGRDEEDDGVILLVAPNERLARIAVGDGLEKKLPDVLCQRIMDEQVVPRFREGDLPGGIEAAVSAIIGRLA